MDTIQAHTKSVSELLKSKKYAIDYYQREYKWQKEQIIDLMEDLEAKFLGNYDESDELIQVKNYKHYFLGSIIVSEHDGYNYIIDGQQRLTSLTLLLMFLSNLQKQQGSKYLVHLNDLIFSDEYGKQSFNLDVTERTEAFQALFANQLFEPNGQSEAVQNIVARYEDIKDKFPQSLRGDALIHFIYWLKDNVDLIEIRTASDDEAYTIFETMNDRGLSLSPTDMLKGYLLANIEDAGERAKANDLWRDRLLELSKLGKDEKDEDADFFKAWLRAKYAASIREHKKNTENRDFDIIGTTFHKWVRDKSKLIGLRTSEDFRDFVMSRFNRFSDHYMRVRQASQKLTPGLEYVFYNAHNNFTLQYPLVLAPLRPEDDRETANRKIRLVAGYLDIFLVHRAVNFRTLDYSSIVYTMFNLMKEIRDLDVPSLVSLFKKKVDMMEESLDGILHFSLNLWSKRYIHHILARITSHIEEQCGKSPNFVNYISREIKNAYEIEHIWADHYDQHKDEFVTEEDFAQYRNHIGNLILLPRDINRSIGDYPYEKKLPVYSLQNILAQSLDEQCYHNNPSFLVYIRQDKLPFRPLATFKKSDLDERQELYLRICEEIWSPARFGKELV